ncbi:MAG: hypothetical protein ABI670_19995 [Chloroflexota bacterium]
MKQHRHIRLALLAVLSILLGIPLLSLPVGAQATSRTFPETGKSVSGRFLTYWQTNGGLAQQGYPISAEMQEKSDTDGKTYTVQYFERAVFELHPENSAPNDVLLSLLGAFLAREKYPNGAPGQQLNTSTGSVLFTQTGKRLGGPFLDYWNKNGGLAQQGYPISDEFTEKSDLDGKTYRVQYFERAVFELHQENQPPYNVLLSQLGTFRYRTKYAAGGSPPQPAPIIPTPIAGCTSNLASGRWTGPLDWQFKLTSDSNLTGDGSLIANLSLDVDCDGTFTGTAATTTYSARGMVSGVRLLTCSATKNPVADFNGMVVPMADGLHLAITGGRWREGTVVCNSPVGAPQTQELTGQPIDPSDIKVETVSDGKITGSQWLSDPALNAIREKVRSVAPGATVDVASTGHWELTYHPINTP